MAQFRYKGRAEVKANGYTFRPNEITEVPDNDLITLQKLRGLPGQNHHASFEEVHG